MSYVAGGIIGVGIFVSPQSVLSGAGQSVGIALCVWAFCAILAVFGGLTYAEYGMLVSPWVYIYMQIYLLAHIWYMCVSIRVSSLHLFVCMCLCAVSVLCLLPISFLCWIKNAAYGVLVSA